MSSKRVLLITSILFFYSYCTNSPTNTDHVTEKAKVSGLIFDVFNQDSMPLKDISVVIDDSTIVSNEQGIFKFEDLELGEYELSFYSDFHAPFDTLIHIMDTTSINFLIQLQPIYYDFAPLAKGTAWVYELKASSRTWSVTGGDNSSAFESQSTLKITVESKNENENEYVFDINMFREGYYTEVSNSDSTTTNFSSTGSYKVIEDKNTSMLSISDLVQDGYWYGGMFYITPFTYRQDDFVLEVSQNNSCCAWDYVSFRRYFPISRLPDQNLYSLSHNIIHQPDSGLTYFGESFGGHTGSGSTSQKLISLSKGN